MQRHTINLPALDTHTIGTSHGEEGYMLQPQRGAMQITGLTPPSLCIQRACRVRGGRGTAASGAVWSAPPRPPRSPAAWSPVGVARPTGDGHTLRCPSSSWDHPCCRPVASPTHNRLTRAWPPARMCPHAPAPVAVGSVRAPKAPARAVRGGPEYAWGGAGLHV